MWNRALWLQPPPSGVLVWHLPKIVNHVKPRQVSTLLPNAKHVHLGIPVRVAPFTSHEHPTLPVARRTRRQQNWRVALEAVSDLFDRSPRRFRSWYSTLSALHSTKLAPVSSVRLNHCWCPPITSIQLALPGQLTPKGDMQWNAECKVLLLFSLTNSPISVIQPNI